MRSLLIRCYPARWRTRYGDEFEALLEERPLGPYDVADILLGAVDARLRSGRSRAHNHHPRSLSMSIRIGGIAAILGAMLIALAVLLGSREGAGDGPSLTILLFVGSVALLVALAVLSAFQARAHPRLIWAAFALAAFGTVAYMISALGLQVGYIGSDTLPEIVSAFAYIAGGIAAVVGYALFGIVTFRTGVLSRIGAALVAASPMLVLIAFLVALSDWDLGMPVVAVAFGGFLLGWLVLGIQAIRLDRPTIQARPA